MYAHRSGLKLAELFLNSSTLSYTPELAHSFHFHFHSYALNNNSKLVRFPACLLTRPHSQPRYQ